ncbi:hypothetical protein HKCCE2091_14185 [Rhodobacterales bacterium HKCCE2091]|nr:hypothetical protein [Rhodobacterales bacterium HKCCE2091]
MLLAALLLLMLAAALFWRGHRRIAIALAAVTLLTGGAIWAILVIESTPTEVPDV